MDVKCILINFENQVERCSLPLGLKLFPDKTRDDGREIFMIISHPLSFEKEPRGNGTTIRKYQVFIINTKKNASTGQSYRLP